MTHKEAIKSVVQYLTRCTNNHSIKVFEAQLDTKVQLGNNINFKLRKYHRKNHVSITSMSR